MILNHNGDGKESLNADYENKLDKLEEKDSYVSQVCEGRMIIYSRPVR